MIALAGILGCVVAVVVGVVAVGVGVGVSLYQGHKQEEAMEEAQEQQNAANARSENKAAATELRQKKITQRNLTRAKAEIGSSIAYARLSAERNKDIATRERQKLKAQYEQGKPVDWAAPSKTKGATI
jgi:predicted negative regulator of RcsB-dependent stress response